MKIREFENLLADRILVFDGAMGTALQEQGLKPGVLPDFANLSKPEIVLGIQEEYVNAGCDLLQTNTFGANRLKLAAANLADSLEEINRRAVQIARQAAGDKALVVGNLGPTGTVLKPYGDTERQEVFAAYFEQASVLAALGVDLFKIETQTFIAEAKLAVMAVRAAAPELPIICSLTYDADLRLLSGTDPETAVSILTALGVSVVGTNCGFGPDLTVPVLAKQQAVSGSYLMAQANAGLPERINGKTLFPLSPEGFAAFVPRLVAAGANIVGGCCGTTPEHIRLVVKEARRLRPKPRTVTTLSTLSAPSQTVFLGTGEPTPIIGERINPTANKRLKAALRKNEMSTVASLGREQVEAGARVLDVNVSIGLGSLRESELMRQAVTALEQAVAAPLSIDTVDTRVMEAGLAAVSGKPLLNSVNGNADTLANLLPLAAKYGAAVLGLTLDEEGIPSSAGKRLTIARRIVEAALKAGIRREDIYIDTLVLTAGAEQAQVQETLRAISLVKGELGVKTALGVSNISHGLPRRQELNSVFLSMALAQGLDLPILNPGHSGVWEVLKGSDLLTGKDRGARNYLAWAQSSPELPASAPSAEELSPTAALGKDIRLGEQERLDGQVAALLEAKMAPLSIINEIVVPALNEVGQLYADRIYFLPQLLLAAQAAEQVFSLLEPHLAKEPGGHRKGVIVIATVAGDIHDIGKNIVALLLKNHGFKVFDLGKDVPVETVVSVALAEKADLVALSSLMTTTMPVMGEVTETLRKRGSQVPILVGGAVVTPAYAESIGAHYAADAISAVKAAEHLIIPKEG